MTSVWPGHIIRAWNWNKARLGLGRGYTGVRPGLGWAGAGPGLGQTSTVISGQRLMSESFLFLLIYISYVLQY